MLSFLYSYIKILFMCKNLFCVSSFFSFMVFWRGNICYLDFVIFAFSGMPSLVILLSKDRKVTSKRPKIKPLKHLLTVTLLKFTEAIADKILNL